MKKSKVHFMPRTKRGRWGFWIAVVCFALIYINYWIAMAFRISIPLPGVLFMLAIIVSGVLSVISIVKDRDYAIGLFISALIGLLGIMFVIGEFLYPH